MYRELECSERKSSGGRRKSKIRNQRVTGFSDEQISSDKNPTNEGNSAVEEIKTDTVNQGSKIRHIGFSSDNIVQEYVQYAYEIGGIDLVTLIDCENGSWNPVRQSEVVKNGKRERSFGFCQTSQVYHPEIVNNPLFRNDRKWQLDKCNELMKGGTAFYGRDRKIKGVKCSKYVLDRFVIEGQ